MKRILFLICTFSLLAVTASAQVGRFNKLTVNDSAKIVNLWIKGITTAMATADSSRNDKVPSTKAVWDALRSAGPGGGPETDPSVAGAIKALTATDTANFKLTYRKMVTGVLYDSATQIFRINLNDGTFFQDTLTISASGGANYYPTGMTFNPATGIYTMTRFGTGNLTSTMDGRYLIGLGGFNNIQTPDSSLIYKITNNLKLGTKYNQFVLSNVDYSLIPSIYQAKGGTHDGNFNPSMGLLVRKFNEATNDTLWQMSYGGAITAYTDYRADTVSTRWRYDNKHIVLPNYGFYSDGRFYAPRDSVEVRTNGNGQSGSGVVSALSIGETVGYNLRINSTQYAPYPVALSISTLDLMRNDSRGRRRRISGNGIAGYVSDWKNYQYGSITSGTNDDSSNVNALYDFYSMGVRNDSVGSGVTKAKIMGVSKVERAIGFFSRQKYHPLNEVWNGFGFYQQGSEDYNYMQGRLKIGGSEPDRNAGGIGYNLHVNGSLRSDTTFNLYNRLDSNGRIEFTARNDASFNGKYLIQLNQTLSASANSTNVAGGLRSYRNWLDPTSIGIPEPTIDSRNYFRIQPGRTENLTNCSSCSMGEYFGYKQIILGAGSTVTHSGVMPRVYWARNEINGLSSGSKGKASSLGLIGFAGQFTAGPNVDSIGTLIQFQDDGLVTNSVNYIGNYYSFYAPITYQSNVGNMYGFYQLDNRIKNYFGGATTLGASLYLNAKDSIDRFTSNGSREMLAYDTTTKKVVRMPIPSGAGGSTDLSFTRTSTTVSVNSSTGTSAVLPVATSSLAGVMSAADKARLDSNLYFQNGSTTGFKHLYMIGDSLKVKNLLNLWGVTMDSTVAGLIRMGLDTPTIKTWVQSFTSTATGDVTTNTNQTITGQKTFTTNDVIFSGISPMVTGGTGAYKMQDGNDGKNFSMTLNTRLLEFTAQQGDFSYRRPFYFNVSAPADAFNLHSTGTFRINSVSTATDIASRKFYVNGSVGYTLDSIPTLGSISGSEWVSILDASTGQAKKTLASNLGGGVTSFSAGTTGLTPSTGTTGAVTLSGTLKPSNGGTGIVTPTQYGILMGGDATALQQIGLGTTGQILTSNGAGVAPTFQAAPSGTISGLTPNSLTRSITSTTIGDAGATDNGTTFAVTRTAMTAAGTITATGGILGANFKATSGGYNTLESSTFPATPSTNETNFGSWVIGGKAYIAYTDDDGINNVLDHSEAFVRKWSIVPTTGAAVLAIGNAAATTIGTLTTPTLASSNLLTQTRRTSFSSGTTAGTVAGMREAQTEFWRGNAAGLGGFSVTVKFGLNTLAAGNRAFVGISDVTAAPTNVDPTTSATPGKVGMAINTNTGNWQLVWNVTGTAPTTSDLGVNYPVNTTDLYELTLYCPPNASSIFYRVRNLSAGFTTTGTLSSNIPASTTFLTVSHWITNNATAAAAILDHVKTTVETRN